MCLHVCETIYKLNRDKIKKQSKNFNKNLYNNQVARKLAMVEADLERAEERAELGEKYVFERN